MKTDFPLRFDGQVQRVFAFGMDPGPWLSYPPSSEVKESSQFHKRGLEENGMVSNPKCDATECHGMILIKYGLIRLEG